MSVSRVNLPILGEVVFNWGVQADLTPAADVVQVADQQHEHGELAPAAELPATIPAHDLATDVLSGAIAPLPLAEAPEAAIELQALAGVNAAGSALGIQLHPEEVVSPLLAPKDPPPREEVGEESHVGAEPTPLLPTQLTVDEKTGEDKGGDAQRDGRNSEEQPHTRTSAAEFAQASASVRAQLQQLEVVKGSLATPVLSEALAETVPAGLLQEVPPKDRVTIPAAAVHRDVPAVQEVLRAKVEDDVSAYPWLASVLEGTIAVLAHTIEERQAAAIQCQVKALLNVLMPCISQESQRVFVSRLNAVHSEVLQLLADGEWTASCTTAAAKLRDTLEKLTDQAARELSPSAEARAVPVRPSLTAKDEATVVPVAGGWNRKHRSEKKRI